ncbi:DUF3822 family protein [Mucilaginibacter sp. FT3.2]|uniref:DUF3822 family protein n=1 Tax=Mucilaginibacter sp. FT3.2 TaxID=2723090 RepID=UPI0016196FB2|nr:DUF3822 family protein [Mucilaginibacter sp. FT3.2]MBB6234691.1 hypothetical protein [Mucilaginibacter sp. FT3.2]
MSEYNYNYHDDDFSLDKAQGYTLLIQIDKTTFTYAVTDQNKLIAIADNHPIDELSNPEELLDLLSANFKNVVIGLPATGFSLLPQTVFNPDKVAYLARFLDVKADEKVLSQPLDNRNVIIYKTPETTLDAVEDFGIRNSVFTSKGWLNALAKNQPGDRDLYLNINGSTVEIANFSFSKLRFYNTFEFTGEDELAYFVSLVTDELAIQPAYTYVYVSGDADAGDKNLSRLSEFFGKVEINTIQTLAIPHEIESHKILSLAALSLCVSSEAL